MRHRKSGRLLEARGGGHQHDGQELSHGARQNRQAIGGDEGSTKCTADRSVSVKYLYPSMWITIATCQPPEREEEWYDAGFLS